MTPFYKLGSDAALEQLGIKQKGVPGYFSVTGPGSGAIMGTAAGTSLATGANTIASMLGHDLSKSTGLTLPQLVALGGTVGAGAGALFGLTQEK